MSFQLLGLICGQDECVQQWDYFDSFFPPNHLKGEEEEDVEEVGAKALLAI